MSLSARAWARLGVLLVGLALGAACYLPGDVRPVLAALLLSAVPWLLARANHALAPALLLLPLMCATYLPALHMMTLERPAVLALYPPLLLGAASLLSSLIFFGVLRLPRGRWAWSGVALLASLLSSLPVLGAYQNVAVPGLLLPGPWSLLLGPQAGFALVLLAAAATDLSLPRARAVYAGFLALLLLGVYARVPLAAAFQVRHPEFVVAAVATGPSPPLSQRSRALWEARDQTLERLTAQAQQANRPHLLVLPEEARYATAFGESGFARPLHVPAGTIYGAVQQVPLGFHNVLYAGQEQRPFYRKRTLVPLAETRWLLPGEPSRVHTVGGVRVGALLCLEGMFPAEVSALARQGAEVLVVPSATTHRWSFQFQRFAIEAAAYAAGLPVVVSNELGGSVIRGAAGQLVAAGAWNRTGTIAGAVGPGRATPFARLGLWPYALLLALVAWGSRRRTNHKA